MILVCVLIGIVAVGIASYFIVRAMKGSMKITVKRSGSFYSGQSIEGSLYVAVKKAINVDRMYLMLIGERYSRSRMAGSDNQSNTWHEVHREEYDVEIAESLPAGFTETFEFAIEAPANPTLSMAKTGNEVMDTMIKGAETLSKMSGTGRMRWFIKARLETKGVDLAASHRINVSLKRT